MDINGKYRPFYIAKLLEELTDENHYLTTVQIINLLKERYGMTSHRHTIHQDIEVLKTVGMDVDCISSSQNRYRLLSRRFDNAELKLLIDAVASSKFISKKKSSSLANRISSLTSTFEAEKLKRNISVENRIKSENEQTLLIIDAINEACEQLKAAGAKRALPLKVGGAFHSPLMQPAKDELQAAIEQTSFNEPVCPIYQNVDGKPHTNPEEIKKNLIAQLTSPVRWTQCVQNMIADGADDFTECGPGKALQGMIAKIDRGVNVHGVI